MAWRPGIQENTRLEAGVSRQGGPATVSALPPAHTLFNLSPFTARLRHFWAPPHASFSHTPPGPPGRNMHATSHCSEFCRGLS